MSRYKQHQKMKRSEAEWIGQEPMHWNTCPSFWLFSLRNEKARKDDKQLTASQKYGVIYQDEYQRLSGSRVVQVITGSEILKHAEKGDFVISMRSFQGGIEYCHFTGSVSSAYVTLVPSDKVFPKFFSFLLKSKSYIQALQSTSNLVRDGQALRYSNFKQVRLPLVSIEEQKRLSLFLEQECLKIDNLIEKQEKLIQLLKVKRQSLISSIVNHGLNSKVRFKASEADWLGEVPAHWKVSKLKYCASIIPSNVDKKSVDGEHPVLLCNYVDVYRNEYIDASIEFMQATAKRDQVKKFSLRENDIIMTKDSEDPLDIGIPSLVIEKLENVLCGYHLALIRCYDSRYSHYIRRVIESNYSKYVFAVNSNGLTRYGLGSYPINNLKIPLPPPEEAFQIGAFLNSRCDKIDSTIKKTLKAIDFLNEKKESLIYSAVTGKIKLCEVGQQDE